jgi:hypothetical protein
MGFQKKVGANLFQECVPERFTIQLTGDEQIEKTTQFF